MSEKFYALLTHQGAAKLANATALGATLTLSHMAVGDGGGTLPTPDPAQNALIGEKRRAGLNSLSVDPNNENVLIAEQMIPESEGGFWIREVGVFDNEGTLIAVGNCPESYKPRLEQGSGRTQNIRMLLIINNSEAVTLKIDPSVILATRQYVDDNVDQHAKSRNHPDGSLTAKGFVQLSSAIGSGDEAMAATPKAVMLAMDNASARLAKDRNGADIPNVALFRQNIGLGNASNFPAVQNGGAADMSNSKVYIGWGVNHKILAHVDNTPMGELYYANNPPTEMSNAGVAGWWRDKVTGMLLQWGGIQRNANTMIVNYHVAYPTMCSAVFMTSNTAFASSSENVRVHSVTATQFRAVVHQNESFAYWFSIGY